MNNETYALLWSKEANCFHVERIADTVRSGMRFFYRNGTNDYLLIGYGSHDEVTEKAEELRKFIVERDEVRRLYDDEQ